MGSGVKLTEGEVVSRVWEVCNKAGLEFHGFTQGSWVGAKNTKLKLYCDKHGISWDSTYYSGFVGNKGKGCLSCGIERRSKKALIPPERYLKRFESTHGNSYIYCITKGVKAKDLIKIKCLVCDNIFEQSPDNHLQGKGCVSCASYGYDKNLPANLYCVIWSSGNQSFVKVGITNNPSEQRIQKQNRETAFNPIVIKSYYHESGDFISNLEKEIKQTFQSGVISKESFPDGYTETFNLSDYKEIVSLINTRMEL